MNAWSRGSSLCYDCSPVTTGEGEGGQARDQNHLKSILRVIEAVDPDAVLQGRAGQRSKDGQFETFGCCLGD